MRVKRLRVSGESIVYVLQLLDRGAAARVYGLPASGVRVVEVRLDPVPNAVAVLVRHDSFEPVPGVPQEEPPELLVTVSVEDAPVWSEASAWAILATGWAVIGAGAAVVWWLLP